MSRLFALILSLVFLIGCTEPVAVPRLPSGEQSPIENILVGRHLEREDIRKIFDGLNEGGNLNEFAKFVLELDDPAIDLLAELSNRHLYRSIFNRDGFVQILDRRLRRLESPSLHSSRVLYQLLKAPNLDRLARFGVHFLDPRFHLLWADPIVPLSTLASIKEGPVQSPSSEATLTDLRSLVNEKDAITKSLTFLQDESLLENVARGVRKVSDFYGARGAAGFASGLGTLVRSYPNEEKTRNSLDLFFQLFEATDEPPEKLFTTTRDIFQNNFDLLSTLAESFGEEGKEVVFEAIETQALSVIQKFPTDLWTKLRASHKDEPGEAFGQVLRANRRALGRVLGTQSNSQKVELFVHSVALTRWLAQSKGNAKKTLSLPEFRLNFVDDTTIDDWAKSLQADPKWLAWIREHHKSGFDQNWNFQFPAFEGTLSDAYKKGLRALHKERELSGGAQFIRSIFITLPTKNGALPWEELDDKENVLALLVQYLKALTPKQLDAVQNLLFEKLNVGKLLEKRPDIPFLYSENPKLQDRVTRLLASIQMCHVADKRSEAKTPSLIETVHRLMKSIPDDELPLFSKVLSFPGRLSLFDLEIKEKGTFAKYAGFYRLVGNEKVVAETLYTISRWTVDQRKVFAQTLTQVFGDNFEESIELFLDAAKTLLEGDPHSLNLVLKEIFEGDPLLSRSEFEWLREFAFTEFGKLWKALSPHISRERAIRFWSEFSRLHQTGELKALLEKLSYMKNPRLARLAQIGLEWQETGDWTKIIAWGETLLKHINATPKVPPAFPWVEHLVEPPTR